MGADFMFAVSPQPSLEDDTRKKAVKDLLKHFAQEDLRATKTRE